MQIVNHKLVGCWYKDSPNIGGALNNPTLLVEHFTASGGDNPTGDADYLSTKAAKASAHIVVGRDGTIKQIVPFNRVAWHAGISSWRGVSNCNAFSIGIEIDNWGRLTKTASGKFVPWTGKGEIPPDRVGVFRYGSETTDSYWELYTEEQLLAAVEVSRLILQTYPSIREVVGHNDIAPKRKVDPGPAFPMQRFKSLVGGRAAGTKRLGKVRSSTLNLRGGAGTQYDRVGDALPKGAVVEIIYDAGEWSEVKVADGRVGWVYDSYLELV